VKPVKKCKALRGVASGKRVRVLLRTPKGVVSSECGEVVELARQRRETRLTVQSYDGTVWSCYLRGRGWRREVNVLEEPAEPAEPTTPVETTEPPPTHTA
jgi:hypothetical protein